MRYLSLFSGIEAASVAWHSLEWTPVAFAEVEPFPSAVLAERFPGVPNFGDVTKFKEWPNACGCDDLLSIRRNETSDSLLDIGGVSGETSDGSLSSIFPSRESDRTDGEERAGGGWVERGTEFHAQFNGSSRNSFCEKCGGIYAPDIIVGGSPCQSFSVAGLRKGMDDPRGNLALTYLAIVDKYRPKWIVWENVPGVLSSNRGRDFGSFIGALDEIGYGYAWRVLDAQYCRTPDYPRAVPQRRRRVFVVGSLRSAGCAGAVLFDSESLSGNPPPSREKRQTFTSVAEASIARESRELVDIHPVATVDPNYKGDRGDLHHATRLVIEATAFKIRGGAEAETGEYGGTPGKKAGKGYLGSDDTAFTVAATQDQQVFITQDEVAATLDASYYKGQGAFQAREREFIAYETNPTDARCSEVKDGVSPTVKARWGTGGNNQALVQAIPLNTMTMQGRPSDEGRMGSGIGDPDDPAPTLSKAHHHGVAVEMQDAESIDLYNLRMEGDIAAPVTSRSGIPDATGPRVMDSNRLMQVRRLTPLECERLQGFPEHWTKIPWRNKPIDDCPNGPRYKAIGNSMAVNVMQWIGIRLAMVEEILECTTQTNEDGK